MDVATSTCVSSDPIATVSAAASGDGTAQLLYEIGVSVYSDYDDEQNECFRSYRNPVKSYKDHSLFLVNRDRYRFLFDINKKDYKAWAEGLKKAGYATDPEYSKKLISLIEKFSLSQLD